MKSSDATTSGLLLTPEQEAAVEQLVDGVVRFGLETPAILFLESVKPMNRLGSTAMVFFQPVFAPFASWVSTGALAELLEDRRAIEYVIRMIERRDRRPQGPVLEPENPAGRGG